MQIVSSVAPHIISSSCGRESLGRRRFDAAHRRASNRDVSPKRDTGEYRLIGEKHEEALARARTNAEAEYRL